MTRSVRTISSAGFASRFDPSKRARRTSARTGCVFAPSRHHRPRTAGRFGSDAIWTRMCPGGYACTSWVREVSRRRAQAAPRIRTCASLCSGSGRGRCPRRTTRGARRRYIRRSNRCGTSISCTNTWTGRATRRSFSNFSTRSTSRRTERRHRSSSPSPRCPGRDRGIHAANRWIDRGRSTRRIGT